MGDDLLAAVVVVDRVLHAPLVGDAVGQPEQVRDVVQGEPVRGLDLVTAGGESLLGVWIRAPDRVVVGEPDRPGTLDLGEPLVEPVVAIPAVPAVAVAEPAARKAAAPEAAPAEAAAGIIVVPPVRTAELVVPEFIAEFVPARPHEVEGRAERHAVQPGPAEFVGFRIVEIVVQRQVHVQPAARDAHGRPQVRELPVLGLEVVGRRRFDVHQVVLLLAALVFGPGLQDVVHGETHPFPDARASRPPGLGEVDVGRDHVPYGVEPADLRLEEPVERRVDRHAHRVVFLLFPVTLGFRVGILLPGSAVPGLRADLQPAPDLLRRAQGEGVGEGPDGCVRVVVTPIRARMGRVHVAPYVVPAVPQRVVEPEHDSVEPAILDLRAGLAEVGHAAPPRLPAGRLEDRLRPEAEPERGGGPARLAGPAARGRAQVEAVPPELLVDREG